MRQCHTHAIFGFHYVSTHPGGAPSCSAFHQTRAICPRRRPISCPTIAFRANSGSAVSSPYTALPADTRHPSPEAHLFMPSLGSMSPTGGAPSSAPSTSHAPAAPTGAPFREALDTGRRVGKRAAQNRPRTRAIRPKRRTIFGTGTGTAKHSEEIRKRATRPHA